MGLRKKTFIYVGVGLTAIVVLSALLSLQTVNQGVELVSKQRLTLTQNIALDIDNVLLHMLSELESFSSMAANNWQNGPADTGIKDAMITLRNRLQNLLELSSQMEVPVSIALLDVEARILLTEPYLEYTQGYYLYNIQVVRDALQSGQSNIVVDEAILTEDKPTLSMVAPIKDDKLATLGLVVVDIPVILGGFDRLLQRWSAQNDLELVNASGLVLASSIPQDNFHENEHWNLINQLVTERLLGIKQHAQTRGEKAHIVTVAPLKQVPWSVVLENPQEEVIALPWVLGRGLLIIGGTAVLVAAILIWGFSRQILSRIRRLAVVAERFGAGDLETEVPSMETDEIGMLARSFESMRCQLKRSLSEINRWNQELEQRVEKRTVELAGLYEQLRRRDEERGALLGKIITAQEEERRRIARELHDDISQTLTGLVMRLGSVETLITSNPPAARRGLEDLRHATSEAVDNARSLIRNLRPSLLDDLGLVPAIGWYVDNYLAAAGVKAKLETSGLDKKLSPTVQIVMFRVVQEAITNIVKHAQAKTARIRLEFTDSAIVGSIEDDGKGFNIEGLHLEKHRGMGLLGMAERIELLKGKFTIESKPGKGTRIHFEIPGEENGG